MPDRKTALPLPGLRWRGFTVQLFLLTILPLAVLLLAITLGSQSLHHEAMRSLVGDRDLRATRSAANSLSEQIHHRGAAIAMLSSETKQAGDISQLLETNPGLKDDFEGGLALLTTQGEILQAPAGSPLRKMDSKLLAAIAVQASIPARDAVFSAPFQAPNGQGLYWVMALHRTIDGSLLAGVFSPASLTQSALSGATDPSQTSVALAAPGGIILYQSGPLASDGSMAGHSGIDSALRGETGIDYIHASSGEHVVAFSPVAPLGWGLVLEESWESIASPLLNLTQSAPLVLVPVVLLALLALWFGARQVIQPLQALKASSAELARGNFEVIEQPVGGISEIRSLQSDLVEMAHSLRAAEDSLHSYIGAINASVENERRSLARELHDDTLQALIALQQRIQLTARQNGHSPELIELQALVEETITNLRRMVRGLRPIYLEDLGLLAALNMLAGEVSANSGVPVAFECQGEEQRLPPTTELSLYRMAQEALSNVTRHAQASQAWVELDYQPKQVCLSVRDDGQGFAVPESAAEFAKQGHFGLLGLQERAELVGANLEIESQVGQGTKVEITIERDDQGE